MLKTFSLKTFNYSVLSALIISINGCSSGVTGKYVDIEDQTHFYEFKSDNTFYTQFPFLGGKINTITGKYSVKDNFLYIDSILTYNGQSPPKLMLDTAKSESRSHPLKIDGSNLIGSYDTKTVFKKQ
jgi:hypothetical protein